jgi:hypothetical protein
MMMFPQNFKMELNPHCDSVTGLLDRVDHVGSSLINRLWPLKKFSGGVWLSLTEIVQNDK